MPQERSKSCHASLTESFCRRLKPATATTVIDYYDTNTPNLSLRLRPPSKQHRGGLLSWRYGFRFLGKPDVLTLGHFPAWPAAMAHARAREARVALDRGLNPREALYHRQESAPAAAALPPADTVKAMLRRYEPTLDEKSDNHRRNVAGYFARFILPAWGERDIHTLTRREIVDLLKVVREKSGPIASNRLGSTTAAWFNFLVKDGVLESSPARALPRSEEQPREQILTVPQLVRVWQAADKFGSQAGNPAGKFVKLLIALPVRRDEAAELPRCEIDTNKNEWLLPAGRNKSGRDFLIPLSTLAQDVLAACPNTGLYFFSSTGKRPISGFSRLKTGLDAEIAKQLGAPLPAWTFHDLRRSITTHLAALGVSDSTKDRVLNHALPKLKRTYDRYGYAAEKREALQLWADHFAAALAASSTPEPEARSAAD